MIHITELPPAEPKKEPKLPVNYAREVPVEALDDFEFQAFLDWVAEHPKATLG